jgi:hypothetical protein
MFLWLHRVAPMTGNILRAKNVQIGHLVIVLSPGESANCIKKVIYCIMTHLVIVDVPTGTTLELHRVAPMTGNILRAKKYQIGLLVIVLSPGESANFL